MRIRIRKVGGSRGVIIPKPLPVGAGLTDEAIVTIENDALALHPVRPLPGKR